MRSHLPCRIFGSLLLVFLLFWSLGVSSAWGEESPPGFDASAEGEDTAFAPLETAGALDTMHAPDALDAESDDAGGETLEPLALNTSAASEAELTAAIAAISTEADKTGTITLTSDISLTATLVIPSGIDVTLAGGYRLIGADNTATITVNGKVTLDGITVTHASASASSEESRGVRVASGASLTLNSGAITQNHTSGAGGGVLVQAGANFTMNGGSITANSAGTQGGGIGSTGTVTLAAGSITDNTAAANGGGVYTSDYAGLSVAAGVTFAGNKASEIYLVTPVDAAAYSTYQSKVAATSWTNPFLIGYNNYDINYSYQAGTTITYDYNFTKGPALLVHIPGGSKLSDSLIASPSRPGYTFLGWRQGYPDGSTLDPETTLTYDPRTLYALWARADLNTIDPSPHNVLVVDYYGEKTWADFYFEGSEVRIDAGTRAGFTFMGWTVNYGAVEFYNGRTTSNTFVMPDEDVKITAMWIPSSVVPAPEPELYSVVVHNSYAAKSWSDFYFPNLDVAIAAGTREGYTFAGWQVDSHNVVLADEQSVSVFFDMPAADVELTALWVPVATTPDAPATPATPGAALPATGDTAAAPLLLATLLLSFASLGAAALLVMRRRRIRD